MVQAISPFGACSAYRWFDTGESISMSQPTEDTISRSIYWVNEATQPNRRYTHLNSHTTYSVHLTHRMNYSRCNAQDHETIELRISLKPNASSSSRINTELSGRCNKTDWAREEMRNSIVVDIPAITWHPNQFLSQVNLSPFHSTQRMCLLLFAIAIIISCVNNISINHTHTNLRTSIYHVDHDNRLFSLRRIEILIVVGRIACAHTFTLKTNYDRIYCRRPQSMEEAVVNNKTNRIHTHAALNEWRCGKRIDTPRHNNHSSKL